MRTLTIFIGIAGLLILGYFALKEGLHKETVQEKMIKATQSPSPKRFPKWYAILLGIACWGVAFYLAMDFFYLL